MKPINSIGKDAAIALHDSEWWKGKSATEIATFQLHTKEMCCPFDVFHEAIEKALGRPVWTHEFALNFDGLVEELNGHGHAPTMAEIIEMIPSEKRIVVIVGKVSD